MRLPALSRFYYGAISPLNVEQYTLRELSEYATQMDQYVQQQSESG